MATEISPAAAAAKAGRHRNTIYNWIRRYQIGRKIGGRWVVDTVRLQQVLDGNHQSKEQAA